MKFGQGRTSVLFQFTLLTKNHMVFIALISIGNHIANKIAFNLFFVVAVWYLIGK